MPPFRLRGLDRTVLSRGYIWIMEKKTEAADLGIWGLGVWEFGVLGVSVSSQAT